MEYNAYLLLDNILPKQAWSVQKLNLNAQPGAEDEDVSITHRRSGVILRVESKSAVRGSMSRGNRSRKMPLPHFNVKCHRSRSNIKLAGTSNDRYAVGCFDVLITNPFDAIFEGNTVGEDLEIVHDSEIVGMLMEYYNVKNKVALRVKCSNDWRFCIPKDIAEDGYVPRTPYVKLIDDPNWRPMNEIEKVLENVVGSRRQRASRRQ